MKIIFFKGRAGFTLMEIIIVAGIMALFSVTLISVFLATVRTGGKAQLTQLGHQEGDFALKTMAAEIREANEVECLGDEINVTSLSGSVINFSAELDSGVNRIASDSSSFLTGVKADVDSLSFTCYPADLGNQVVTIRFNLTIGVEDDQVQERFNQEFATSISTRQI